jgi:hypothetical protein
MFSLMPSRDVGKLYVSIFVLTASLASISGWAQVTGSAMTGSVKDSTGAIVPDATVTIKNIESGQTRTVNTDANGNYTVPSLAVGQYEIDAEKSGFKQAVRRGVNLVVGQQAVVNITLEVGNVEQQVTVTAEAPLVNTTVSSTPDWSTAGTLCLVHQVLSLECFGQHPQESEDLRLSISSI